MNIIFTAIIGNYDHLKEIQLEPGWRAICFTDSDIQSKSWEIVRINGSEKICREIKISPYGRLPDHEKSVWIDGNLELKIPLSKLAEGKEGFWLMNHPDRNCLYEEAQRCIELGKDKEEIIKDQVWHYLTEGYPHNNGLSATGVIIRGNTDIIRQFSFLWWIEVEKYSRRDQLSFNYAAWKYGLNYKTFPFLENFTRYHHVPKEQELEARRLEKMNRKRRARITRAGQILLQQQKGK